MGDRDDVSRLAGIAYDEYKEHSKKIEGFLDEAQERFSKDHASTAGGLGVMMILGAFAMAILDVNGTFAVLALCLGVLVLCLALLMRSRASDKQIRYTSTLVNLEGERSRLAQKQAVLHYIWLHGIPEGTPLNQIQILLGEQPSVREDQKWKQLESGNDSHFPEGYQASKEA